MILLKKNVQLSYVIMMIAIAISLSLSISAQSQAADSSDSATSGSGGSTTWTGFYIGAYGGGHSGKSNAGVSTVYSPAGYFAQTSVSAINSTGGRQLKPTGIVGGGTVGYNYQVGRVVVGAEADFGALRLEKAESSTGSYPCCSPATYTISHSLRSRWLLTVRPRIGVTVGNALIYGTAGLAAADLNYQAAFSDTYGAARENGDIRSNRAGWTGGGGVEFKFGKHWSAKGEYLYSDLGSVSITSTNLSAASVSSFAAIAPSQLYPSNAFTHTSDLKLNNFRFGINFHF